MPSEKNDYDIDMDDTEETKEEPTIAIRGVPVENLSSARKSINQYKMEQEEQDQQYLSIPQGGHNYGSRRQSES